MFTFHQMCKSIPLLLGEYQEDIITQQVSGNESAVAIISANCTATWPVNSISVSLISNHGRFCRTPLRDGIISKRAHSEVLQPWLAHEHDKPGCHELSYVFYQASQLPWPCTMTTIKPREVILFCQWHSVPFFLYWKTRSKTVNGKCCVLVLRQMR